MSSRRFSLYSSLHNSTDSLGGAFFLVILAMVLCSFVVTAFIASVPLTILLLRYGYRRALAVAMTAGGFFFLLAMSGGGTLGVSLLYLLALLLALLINQVIRYNQHPVRGVYLLGGSLLLLAVGAWGVFSLLSEVSFAQYVEQMVTTFLTAASKQQEQLLKSASSAEALYLKELMEKPHLLATELVHWLPAMVVVTSFFSGWLSLMLVLRNRLMWQDSVEYGYQLSDLINFRVPDYFVYPLIISLALALGSSYLGIGTSGELVAYSLMYILAVFYFFHGFGVYVAFLDFMHIYGLMRSLLVVMTIMLANRMLILIGVFDLWVNFRKFLQKKNNEGDIS